MPVTPETEAVAARVLAHFEENKPEPASFPMMASRVIDLAEHPDVDASKLAHLIERDPAICAAVLAVANSALNRRGEPVTAVRTAVTRLGLRRVADIAVGVACRSLFDVEVRVQNELFSGWWEKLFHAAMTEAFACSFVALELGRGSSEGIFLLGLLHDLGKSLGLRSLAALTVAGELAPLNDEAALERVLTMNNARIGSAALERFSMPEDLVAACRIQSDENIPVDSVDVHVLRLVSSLNSLRMETLDTDLPIRIVKESAAALGLDVPAVLDVARQLSEQSAQIAALFSTTDGAEETGYLDFVARCISDVPPVNL